MTSKLALGIAASLIVPVCLGCSANSGIVRGQTPATVAQPAAGGVQQIAYQSVPQQQRIPVMAAAYPTPQTPSADGSYYCPPPVYNPHGHGLRQHRHWFTYDQPTDLRYPAANSPAPIVQYPYYTVKGPSDFFLK